MLLLNTEKLSNVVVLGRDSGQVWAGAGKQSLARYRCALEADLVAEAAPAENRSCSLVNVWVMFVEPWETRDQRDAGSGQETKLDGLMMVTRNQLVDGAFWPENPR